jgi:hypothetical protein
VLPQADYYAFERVAFTPEDLSAAGRWDYFWSAYDESQRVQVPFQQVIADEKQWLVHQEYGFCAAEHPAGAAVLSGSFDPPDVLRFVREHASKIQGKSLCVDATGFVRPHLLVLLRALRDIGLCEFDVLYSDPVRYVADEETPFATGPVVKVEQVPGYAGVHRGAGFDDEILVVGAGYDYEHIIQSCEARRTSRKYLLTGLPSLQPHMYQESILRLHRAHEAIGDLSQRQRLYASASQPFAVAQLLHETVDREARESAEQGRSPRNIYLCPLGPKPHVIGFAVYYLRELEDTAASIIYPFSECYSRLTAEGLLRTWKYHIEF